MTTFQTIENAYNDSTLNNNLFERVVKSLAVSSFVEGTNTTFNFADGSSLDCDSLDPFELHYATFISGDLSLVAELHKAA